MLGGGGAVEIRAGEPFREEVSEPEPSRQPLVDYGRPKSPVSGGSVGVSPGLAPDTHLLSDLLNPIPPEGGQQSIRSRQEAPLELGRQSQSHRGGAAPLDRGAKDTFQEVLQRQSLPRIRGLAWEVSVVVVVQEHLGGTGRD